MRMGDSKFAAVGQLWEGQRVKKIALKGINKIPAMPQSSQMLYSMML